MSEKERAMTTYTPPAEAVEAAAKAIAENTDEPGWSAVVIARAALTAAGPIIAAGAECSLLNHENRLAEAAVKIDRLKAERDEAQRQVADLRAGSGSGEQPGEDVTCSRCQTCGRDQRAGWCKHPAPAVPDSADVREDGDGLLPIEQSLASALWARWADRGGIPCVTIQEDPRTVARALRPWLLAAVGQGVTADDVPEQIARYVEATATDLSPSGYRAGIATAVRLIRRWRPECAAVRPSEQEGS